MKCRVIFIPLLFSTILYSQIQLKRAILVEDLTIKYDTLFVKEADSVSVATNLFDEKIVQSRLDSLNELTPIDIAYNKTIGKYIRFYLFQRREQVSKLLSLSEYYFPIFERYLDQHSLPLELKYLPIIESALNPNAKSPAGATGIWQFMYFTAKEYGLRINSYLDERKDIYKATNAACNYFLKSYSVFENWGLAIASYNAGRRNVTKAIRRSGGKLNYWEIRPFLPQETRNYIPSFIAALYVMNFASEYGISASKNINFKTYQADTVHLKQAIKIEHLAKILEIDSEVLEDLNPVYRLKLIPGLESEKFPILLPAYKWGLFLANEDSIYIELDKMIQQEKLEFPVFTDIEKIVYKVKRGDYLGRIARNHNCRVLDIMLWNDLKTTKIREGNKLYIYQTIK